MKKYDNFVQHLEVLKKAPGEDLQNEFIISGIIDKFFIQFELGWKLLKEILKYEGQAVAATGSPREIIKAAYQYYNFMDEEIWLEMLKNRNDLSHVYDGNQAKKLVSAIIENYIPTFIKMECDLREQYGDLLKKI